MSKYGYKTSSNWYYSGSFTFKTKVDKDIWEDVTLNIKPDLFPNYLKEPQNIDINWEVLV